MFKNKKLKRELETMQVSKVELEKSLESQLIFFNNTKNVLMNDNEKLRRELETVKIAQKRRKIEEKIKKHVAAMEKGAQFPDDMKDFYEILCIIEPYTNVLCRAMSQCPARRMYRRRGETGEGTEEVRGQGRRRSSNRRGNA